jgi:hypothetical protein
MSTDIAVPERVQGLGQSDKSAFPEVVGIARHKFHYFAEVTLLVSSLYETNSAGQID